MRHWPRFCPANPNATATKLPGRTWNSETFEFDFDDEKDGYSVRFDLLLMAHSEVAGLISEAVIQRIEHWFCKETVEAKEMVEEQRIHWKGVVERLREERKRLSSLERELSEVPDDDPLRFHLELAIKREKRACLASIEDLYKRLYPPHPAASLSELSSPCLTPRKRLFYHDVL